MSTRWEWLVGTRYLRSAHRRGFVSFVAAISVIGLILYRLMRQTARIIATPTGAPPVGSVPRPNAFPPPSLVEEN